MRTRACTGACTKAHLRDLARIRAAVVEANDTVAIRDVQDQLAKGLPNHPEHEIVTNERKE